VPKKTKSVEEHLKTVQILLAGLLLKEEPRPVVDKLEELIEVRKGTLAEIFPQRKTKKRAERTRE
jgi:hypothetical protein